MTPGYLQLDRPFKVGLLSIAITALMCTHAMSQEAPNRRAHIGLTRVTSGVSDRDMIARACTKTAIAAVSAHAAGELSTVLNEAAKVGKGGSSNNQFFNTLVKSYRLDTSEDFLFASLFDARLNLMWLEQLSGAYSSDKELMFTTYLAARCGATANPFLVPEPAPGEPQNNESRHTSIKQMIPRDSPPTRRVLIGIPSFPSVMTIH